MSAWLVIVAIGVGTYAFRASMFVLLGERPLPSWTTRPLALVAPAAIAALLASMTLTRDGSAGLATAPELAAVAAAFVTTRRTGNVMHAIVVGLPVFWLIDLVLA